MLMAEPAAGMGEAVGVGLSGLVNAGLDTVGDARAGGGRGRVLTEKVKPSPNLCGVQE